MPVSEQSVNKEESQGTAQGWRSCSPNKQLKSGYCSPATDAVKSCDSHTLCFWVVTSLSHPRRLLLSPSQSALSQWAEPGIQSNGHLSFLVTQFWWRKLMALSVTISPRSHLVVIKCHSDEWQPEVAALTIPPLL